MNDLLGDVLGDGLEQGGDDVMIHHWGYTGPRGLSDGTQPVSAKPRSAACPAKPAHAPEPPHQGLNTT
ncbi:MAG TPA: hypothetical protein VFS67_22395 [Polyangiaceae bacterium]|nr:hypothetical protein [Polyangiaceae bacterium]